MRKAHGQKSTDRGYPLASCVYGTIMQNYPTFAAYAQAMETMGQFDPFEWESAQVSWTESTWVRPAEVPYQDPIPGYWVTETYSLPAWMFTLVLAQPSSPGNRDVTTPGIETLFHTPETENIWKQSDCIVNKPFNTAADDIKWTVAGAAFVGASSQMGGGTGAMIKGAIETAGAEAITVTVAGGIALHSLVSTLGSVVKGCKDE